MVQLIKDHIVGIKNRLGAWWQGRFYHGIHFNCLSTGLMRYTNGCKAVQFTAGTLTSVATGHRPFNVIDFVYITGERSCFHLTILGFVVGTIWVSDLAEDGSIKGPDYRKMYTFFECINYQHKQIEEII